MAVTAVTCPLCGVAGHACGPCAAVTAVDIPTTMKGRQMGELREYHARINGADTTVQLTEADAKRLGATPVTAAPCAPRPDAAMSARPVDDVDSVEGKSRVVLDKARAPRPHR